VTAPPYRQIGCALSALDFPELLLSVLRFSGDEYVSICHKTNYLDAGVDLAALPAVMTSKELAPIVRTAVASLATIATAASGFRT
jgi:hypothetical protein